jgi:hypothetical protein
MKLSKIFKTYIVAKKNLLCSTPKLLIGDVKLPTTLVKFATILKSCFVVHQVASKVSYRFGQVIYNGEHLLCYAPKIQNCLPAV